MLEDQRPVALRYTLSLALVLLKDLALPPHRPGYGVVSVRYAEDIG
jgi:hypothetical protein